MVSGENSQKNLGDSARANVGMKCPKVSKERTIQKVNLINFWLHPIPKKADVHQVLICNEGKFGGTSDSSRFSVRHFPEYNKSQWLSTLHRNLKFVSNSWTYLDIIPMKTNLSVFTLDCSIAIQFVWSLNWNSSRAIWWIQPIVNSTTLWNKWPMGTITQWKVVG